MGYTLDLSAAEKALIAAKQFTLENRNGVTTAVLRRVSDGTIVRHVPLKPSREGRVEGALVVIGIVTASGTAVWDRVRTSRLERRLRDLREELEQVTAERDVLLANQVEGDALSPEQRDRIGEAEARIIDLMQARRDLEERRRRRGNVRASA